MLSSTLRASPAEGRFEVVHALPGRVRLRMHGLYRGEALRAAFAERLKGRPDLRLASASVTTGTALIQHDPGLSLQHLLAELNRLLADLDGGGAKPEPASLRRLAQGQPMWRAAPRPPRAGRRATGGSGEANRSTPQPTGRPGSDWHTLTVEQVQSRLGVDYRQGLSEAEGAARLATHGSNELPEARRRSALALFLSQFNSLPVLLLGGSALLSAATGGLADAAVILGVVLVNAGIGYATESQAEKIIGSLTRQTQPPAPVVRDGRIRVLPARELVPGDVLLLTPGCMIAADARLVRVKGLSVDESALTGESLPVHKAVAPLDSPDLPLGDRRDMVYRGTAVTGGSGVAVVVATGRATELGLIQALVGEARAPQTPMQRQLDGLGNQLVWASLAICGLVFAVGLLRGYGFLAMLRAAISLAVAAVPEGLPTVATTTLALGLRDMGRHKVLIRQLAAVETLGSVQVLCLDKTGTLTENRMAVLAVQADGRRLRVEAAGRFMAPEGRVDPHAGENQALLRLIHVAVLCNESQVNGGAEHVRLDGSATENALLAMAIGAGVDVDWLRRRYPLLKIEYRAEGRPWMSTWHAAEDGRRLRAVKGSPEQVMALCRWHWHDGRRMEIGDEDRVAMRTENERMAGEALRVLGFAYGYEEAEGQAAEDGLTWLGLAGLADPIRAGAPELIAQFHQAGIKTVMITGDQSATAYAIGRRLGLSGDDKLEILDSTQIQRIEPDLLSALAEKVDIFSRVSPADKLQIVQGLQRAGKVVAMTGDGVNDGPALKAADIGVAMGGSSGGGTELARSVADVILEDDELQTMILAVSRGRTIYANIRKAIHYLVSSNLSEIGVTFMAVAGGLGQPLNTMQLLWINLLTDVFPALALSLDPPEPDVLRHPPRDPAEPIIRRQDFVQYGIEAGLLTAGALGAYGWGLLRHGPGPQAGTLAFMSLTLGQLLHARACRSRSLGLFSRQRLPANRWLDRALIASGALQLGTVLPTPLRGLLGSTPVMPVDALVVAAGAGLPHLVIEALKRPASATKPWGEAA